MIALALRKELRAMARDGRTVALTLALAALLLGVLLASLQRHEAQLRETAAVSAATRQQWDAQGDKHPHRGAHFGHYVFRPDSVLAVIDPGLTPYLGRALWLEPHRRNITRFEPAADALPGERFGRLDVAFVLSALLPLLVVALSFDAISRERESGTLRMLHGIGVAPWRLVAAKFAAPMLAFGLAAMTPLLAAAGSSPADTDMLWRGAALAAGYFVHVGVFVAIALIVSARAPSSHAALYWLLAWWLAAVLVVPRAAAAVADHLQPLPGADAFWAAIQRDYQQGLPGDGNLAERGRRFDAELMRRYGVARLDDLPVGAAPLRRLERDRYADRVHQLHFDALWDRYARHQRILRAAALLSPTLALQNLSMKLAGTDLSHQRHFEAYAERYRREVNTAIDRWDAEHTRGFRSFEDRYAGEALWRAIPSFSYRPPDVHFALREAVPEVGALLGWTVAGLILLGASARRLTP